jgi:hypothetical protein
VSGNIPLTAGDIWYRVTFEKLDDPSAHPRILLEGVDAGGPGFRFELVKSCAREALTCGPKEDASTAKLTDYEGSYEDAAPGETGDAFVPIALGAGGVVYIHVFRSGAATDCAGFSLKLTN